VSAVSCIDRYLFFFLAAAFGFVREAAVVAFPFFAADFAALAAGFEGFADFFAGAGAAFLTGAA